MTTASELIVRARQKSGMTQSQLAHAMGTTQSAVARLEGAGANPTVETLERALEATGHRLEISAAPREARLDKDQIARLLRLTPSERLATFTASYRNTRRLLGDIRSRTA